MNNSAVRCGIDLFDGGLIGLLCQRGIARIYSGLVLFHSGLELRAEHFVLQGLDLRHFHALFGTLDVRQIGLLLFVIFGLHDGA